MDAFEPGFICNHSDHTGRYAFDQQPGVALWNLQALAVALSTLIETDKLKEALSTFAATFIEHFTGLMHRKLGFAEFTPQTADMAEELLQIMMHSASDYINPKYVLRNWIAETVIRAVEDRDDLTVLDRIMRVLQSPFEEHPADVEFAAPPPEPLRHLSVYCSS